MHYSKKGNIDRKSILQRQREEMEEQQYYHTLWRKQELQRKATEIDAPDSVHEKQADEIGRKVANNESAVNLVQNQTSLNASPQTKSETNVPEVTADIQTKLDSTKGGGKNLDANTKTSMEQNMGVDLSGVKIHTDSKANELSESINAKAFTHEQDVYFKEGNYNTESKEGKELLGHELAHTVQQKGGNGVNRKIQRKAINPDTKKDFVKLKSPQLYGTGDKKVNLYSDNSTKSTKEIIVDDHMAVEAHYQSADKKWLYVIWEHKHKGYMLTAQLRHIELSNQFGADRDQLLKDILQRFKPIINKFGLHDVISPIGLDELKRMQSLLTDIEPDLINENFSGTNFLVDGKKYSAQKGKYRLILVDAEDAPGGYHHVYYNLKSNTLQSKYTPINEQYEKEFNTFKGGKISGAVSNINTLGKKKSPATPAKPKTPVAKEQKKFKSSLWESNEQLLATLRKDPKKGHIIGYNVAKEGGASGRYVGLIHEALLFLDYKAKISEKEQKGQIYGESTYAVVKAYQQKKELPVTGQVDAATLEALDNDLVEKVEKNRAFHDEAIKNTADKQEKEKEESDLRQIRYNKSGHIIFNLPPLRKDELMAMGFNPSDLKFIYIDQGDYAETSGLGGQRFNVEYEGAFLGYITLQPSAGKPNQRNVAFYKQFYQGKQPKYWDEFLNGRFFDLEFDNGDGGDPDLIYLIGQSGFQNHWGMDKREIFSEGLDSGPMHGGAHFPASGKKIKGPGGGKIRSGDGDLHIDVEVKPITIGKGNIRSRASAIKFKLGKSRIKVDGEDFDLAAMQVRGKDGKLRKMTDKDIEKLENRLAAKQNQEKKIELEEGKKTTVKEETEPKDKKKDPANNKKTTKKLKEVHQSTEPKMTPAEFEKLAGGGEVNPNDIRFSQNSASYEFKEGGNIDDLAEKLKKGKSNKDIPPIRIVKYVKGQNPDLEAQLSKKGISLETGVYTLDNRRLITFQKAGIKIRYQKLNHIPKGEYFKFSTNTNGLKIDILDQIE